MTRPHLLCVPGLGADARLFDPQKETFAHLNVVPWIMPEPKETLADYAGRMAAGVSVSKPFYLLGVSLGAMLALEMAWYLKPAAVFMVAGCRSGASIPIRGRVLNTLGKYLPAGLIRKLAPGFAGRMVPHEALVPEHRACLKTMVSEASVPFMKWAGSAIMKWRFEKDLSCPVYSIHGPLDRIIPLAGVQADFVVPGAGHFLNMTHAQELNAYMIEKMSKEVTHG